MHDRLAVSKTSGVLVLLTAVATSHLLAQSAGLQIQPSRDNPTITVDVVASDKKKTRLTELRPEELTVMMDGSRVLVERSQSASSVAAQPEGNISAPEVFYQAPPGSYSNLLSGVGHARETLIVLSDVLNTPVTRRDKVRRVLMQLLEHGDFAAHITIYGLSSRLRILQDYSGDPKTLLAAMQTAGKDTSGSSVTATPSTGRVLPPPASSNLSPTEFLQTVQEYEAFQGNPGLDDRITTTLSGLGGIARQFENIPGRKALIWIATDFPCVFVGVNLDSRPECEAYRPMLASVFGRVQRAHISVYPVTTEVEEQKRERGPIGDAFERSPRSASPIPSAPERTTQGGSFEHDLQIQKTAVKTIAEVTGGRVLDMDHLQQGVEIARRDCEEYLQLALQAGAHSRPGQHALDIATTRRGISLLFRHKYYGDVTSDPPPMAPTIADEVEDALVNDRLQSTGVALLARKQDGNAVVDLIVDARALKFQLQADGNYAIDLDLGVAILSPSFRLLTANTGKLRGVLSRENLEKAYDKGVEFHIGYPFNQRTRFVRILIRDPQSGEIGTVNVPVDCPACRVLPADN